MPHVPPHKTPAGPPQKRKGERFDEKVVLASASPRRQELLRAAGISFQAIPSDINEVMKPKETPEGFVCRMAVEKAEDVAARRPRETRLIVGADTVVVLNHKVLGKPASVAQATGMLRRLAGRIHAVLTGLCVLEPRGPLGRRRRRVELVRTRVQFARLTEEEILDYVATGEPMDKAGAYAIQGRGSRFVKRIDGSYFNVVGLPVPTLYRMLKQFRGR